MKKIISEILRTDVSWNILRLPFAYSIIAGYLWQTVDVKYGGRLSLSLWAEAIRSFKGQAAFHETIVLGELTGIHAIGIIISSYLSGLILGLVCYLAIRGIFLNPDKPTLAMGVEVGAGSSATSITLTSLGVGIFAGTKAVTGTGILGLALNLLGSFGLMLVLFGLLQACIGLISFAASATILPQFGDASHQTGDFLEDFANNVRSSDETNAFDKVMKKKQDLEERSSSHKYTFLLGGALVMGGTLGYLIYQLLPLFYINFPPGL